MLGSIKLTRFLSNVDTVEAFPQHNWPLVIHATSTGDMPAEVFVFQRKGPPLDPSQYDTFNNVASAHDVFELGVVPSANPEGSSYTPFYRGSVVRLFLRSPEEVDGVWQDIKSDVQALVRNLEAENVLKAVDQTEISVSSDDITDTETVTTEIKGMSQTLLTLDYRPAGTAEVDVDNNQTISSPDTNLTGWLPISEAGPELTVPAGAKFFYNTAAEPAFASALPFLEPGNIHLFYMEGRKLIFNQTYHINSTGIFWLEFDPVLIEDDVVFTDGQVMFEEGNLGNAPWPLDYVDRGNPGSVTPTFEILLFS